MRPTYAVERTRQREFKGLAVLSAEEVLQQSEDQAAWLVGDFTWSDVSHWLENETDALSQIERRSETIEDFHFRAGNWPWETDEPWPVSVGVTSVVAALNAAGCPTAWSSPGGPRKTLGVTFFADAERARFVLAVAERCDLGLIQTEHGLLYLTAGAESELVEAAIELLAWREELDALPPPPTAALSGTDGYWAIDLDQIREALEID